MRADSEPIFIIIIFKEESVNNNVKEESVSNPDSPASGEQTALPPIPLHPSSPTPTSNAPFNAMTAASKYLSTAKFKLRSDTNHLLAASSGKFPKFTHPVADYLEFLPSELLGMN